MGCNSYFSLAAMILFFFIYFLQPIRICLVGPPAVGKTTVAEKLCSHYQLHHIKVKEVIEEEITKLVSQWNRGISFAFFLLLLSCNSMKYTALLWMVFFAIWDSLQILIVHVSCVMLQKEKVNEADPEYFSEEVAAAAQKQLEHLNKSMEKNG